MGPTVVYGWAIAKLIRRGAPGSRALYDRVARYLGAPAAASLHIRRWRNLKRWLLVAGLGLLLVLTGPVNVYLGVHWPSDVVGGYLWGAALLLPALAVDRVAQAR